MLPLERFQHERVRAHAGGEHGVIFAGAAGHRDDRDARLDMRNGLHSLKTVEARHVDIDQRDIEPLCLRKRDSRESV